MVARSLSVLDVHVQNRKKERNEKEMAAIDVFSHSFYYHHPYLHFKKSGGIVEESDSENKKLQVRRSVYPKYTNNCCFLLQGHLVEFARKVYVLQLPCPPNRYIPDW